MRLLKKRKDIPNKKYKWEMVFKNGIKIDGDCKFPNLDSIYKVFLKGDFNQLKNNTKRILL